MHRGGLKVYKELCITGGSRRCPRRSTQHCLALWLRAPGRSCGSKDELGEDHILSRPTLHATHCICTELDRQSSYSEQADLAHCSSQHEPSPHQMPCSTLLPSSSVFDPCRCTVSRCAVSACKTTVGCIRWRRLGMPAAVAFSAQICMSWILHLHSNHIFTTLNM